MQAKDSATIAYSAEPEVLTISILKSSAKSVLQALVDLGAVSIGRAKAAKQEVYEQTLLLQEIKESVREMNMVKNKKITARNARSFLNEI